MHVISYKAIREYKAARPAAGSALDNWYRVATGCRWKSFAELRQVFASADGVSPYVVFDIAGNKYRLIAEINFRSQMLIPMKAVTDSDLMPGSDSDVMPVTIGAKRRWRDHSDRSDRHPSTGMQFWLHVFFSFPLDMNLAAGAVGMWESGAVGRISKPSEPILGASVTSWEATAPPYSAENA